MRLKFLFLIFFAVLAANVAILGNMPDAVAESGTAKSVSRCQGSCVHGEEPNETSCNIDGCGCPDVTHGFDATFTEATGRIVVSSTGMTGSGCDEGMEYDTKTTIQCHEHSEIIIEPHEEDGLSDTSNYQGLPTWPLDLTWAWGQFYRDHKDCEGYVTVKVVVRAKCTGSECGICTYRPATVTIYMDN